MTETKLERPRQVTMAAWMIMGGSVLLVGAVFERVSTLHRLETQDAVRQFLAEPPANGFGLDLEGALTILRTMSMVTAGCAAAAAILGYHVLKRNRGARIGLTVLAVPLFIAGFVIGGFLSSLVAVSAVMLWLAPARDWFDGVAPSPREQPGSAAADPEWPPPLPTSSAAPTGPPAAAGLRLDPLRQPRVGAAPPPTAHPRRTRRRPLAPSSTWPHRRCSRRTARRGRPRQRSARADRVRGPCSRPVW